MCFLRNQTCDYDQSSYTETLCRFLDFKNMTLKYQEQLNLKLETPSYSRLPKYVSSKTLCPLLLSSYSLYLFVSFSIFVRSERWWRTMTCAPDRSLPPTWQISGPHLLPWIPTLLPWIRFCTGNARDHGMSMCFLFSEFISRVYEPRIYALMVYLTGYTLLDFSQVLLSQALISDSFFGFSWWVQI